VALFFEILIAFTAGIFGLANTLNPVILSLVVTVLAFPISVIWYLRMLPKNLIYGSEEFDEETELIIRKQDFNKQFYFKFTFGLFWRLTLTSILLKFLSGFIFTFIVAIITSFLGSEQISEFIMISILRYFATAISLYLLINKKIGLFGIYLIQKEKETMESNLI
jgi:hypothetical protein